MLERELKHVATAYVFSKYGHRGQQRDNGERYFEHPRAVALIILDEMEIRNDWQLIVIALLHDIVEDSWLLDEDRLEKNFGRAVALGIKYLTKDPTEKKELYLARLRSYATWRVLLVKLCDRVHNLRTLDGCSEEKQRKQILETEKEYIPLINLLGNTIPKDYKQHIYYLKDNIKGLCKDYRKRLGMD